jgi:hypothetical protein
MLVSLTKTTAAAAFAVGLALAGAVVSPADAAMRHGGGGSSHGGGIQHSNFRGGGHRGHGGGYGGYAEGYRGYAGGFGGYGDYGGGCPLSPVGLITGYYC